MNREISKLRKLAGWSQYQLAHATGIDRTRLSLIENKHVEPSADEQTVIEQMLLQEISRRKNEFTDVLSV